MHAHTAACVANSLLIVSALGWVGWWPLVEAAAATEAAALRQGAAASAKHLRSFGQKPQAKALTPGISHQKHPNAAGTSTCRNLSHSVWSCPRTAVQCTHAPLVAVHLHHPQKSGSACYTLSSLIHTCPLLHVGPVTAATVRLLTAASPHGTCLEHINHVIQLLACT
jgi:hypothetical protein